MAARTTLGSSPSESQLTASTIWRIASDRVCAERSMISSAFSSSENSTVVPQVNADRLTQWSPRGPGGTLAARFPVRLTAYSVIFGGLPLGAQLPIPCYDPQSLVNDLFQLTVGRGIARFGGTEPTALTNVRFLPNGIARHDLHQHDRHFQFRSPFSISVPCKGAAPDIATQSGFLQGFLQCGLFPVFTRIDDSLGENPVCLS